MPNHNVAKVFELPNGVRRAPLDAQTALAVFEHTQPGGGMISPGESPDALRRLGVKRLCLVRGVAGGPNPTFVWDWLFVEALRPLPSLGTLTLVEDGKGSVPQLLGRRLVEKALQQTVLPAKNTLFSLEIGRASCRERVF